MVESRAVALCVVGMGTAIWRMALSKAAVLPMKMQRNGSFPAGRQKHGE